MRSSEGWSEIGQERKREIIAAIENAKATPGPAHAELDLTDRCNVACYFCNQQDVRSAQQVPVERALRLIDELVAGGLKSVRLAGGGDPLFHKQILEILRHLRSSSVVIDNVTTNGIALGPEIAEELVGGGAREVIFSLNAVDAEDYHRMMKVKPAFFDQVLRNIRGLIARRGDGKRPHVVLQFLLDRRNFEHMVEMYDLAVSLGVDTVFFNMVLEIPLERIDTEVLLRSEDAEVARPLFVEILRRDKRHKILEAYFPNGAWQAMAESAQAEFQHQTRKPFPIAESFRVENSGCFFGWYSTVVTGNGNVHPCCLLLKPGREPLGNILHEPFAKQWNGLRYTKLREEMRDVLLFGSNVPYHPRRFEILEQACTDHYSCWLKNMYFRGDEEFYRELGESLGRMRAKRGPLRRAVSRWAGRNRHFGYLVSQLSRWSKPIRRWLNARRVAVST